MHKRYAIAGCQLGFTLVELTATLVILTVLISVAFKKYIIVENMAQLRAIEAGVTELNSRETLTWTNHMFQLGGYQNDGAVWTTMTGDTFLGPEYGWSAGPNNTGGTLTFDSQAAALTRTSSDQTTPGKWRM